MRCRGPAASSQLLREATPVRLLRCMRTLSASQDVACGAPAGAAPKMGAHASFWRFSSTATLSSVAPQPSPAMASNGAGDSTAAGAPFPVSLSLRRHRKLHALVQRELREELLRDFLPEKPPVPAGWTMTHDAGSSRFDLWKTVRVPQRREPSPDASTASFSTSAAEEELHCVVFLEKKQYEGTYRMDNGERESPEYFNFTLFVRKPAAAGARTSEYDETVGHGGAAPCRTRGEAAGGGEVEAGGGLEFGLTAIDMELVIDSIAVHPTDARLRSAALALSPSPEAAVTPSGACTTSGTCGNGPSARSPLTNLQRRWLRSRYYRGPMIAELDDDFSDELLEYLDERGVNAGFAEYVMKQAYHLEQEEYRNWLSLLKEFAQ